MRKICIFTSHYLPYLGGIESYTFNLVQTLKAMGDEVLIVTNNDMGLKKFEVMDGVGVMRLPCFNFMGGRYPITKYGKEFRKMYSRLLEKKFDLVLINARFYPHTLLGAGYARKSGARCVILDHGTSHMTIGKKIPDLIFACVEHMLTFMDKRLCKEYFGVSDACCRWLQHFGIQAEGILYNAINPDKILDAVKNPVRDFRKEFHLTSETTIITYTGRLLKEKGILKLLDAMELIDEREDICLFIAGDGEEMEAVKKRENGKIHPLGRLSFEEICSLLGQTDIYCLPTEYPEGFPTAVLEAGATGCYIITSDKGGSRELITDDSYGKILYKITPESIASAIREALENPELVKKASAAVQAKTLSEFTWEKTAGKVHNLAKENET